VPEEALPASLSPFDQMDLADLRRMERQALKDWQASTSKAIAALTSLTGRIDEALSFLSLRIDALEKSLDDEAH
jgi:hypothetical protein